MGSYSLPCMTKSHMKSKGRKPKGLMAVKLYYSQKLYQKQLLEILETRDGNENGLHIIQQAKVHTFPAH